MPSSIALTSSAYSLLLLHAAAHPQSTVTGLLLGKAGVGAGEEILVEKVVPLAHHWTNLSTLEDVGLELLSSHLISTASQLTIVGLYEAPAKATAIVLSHSALRLANKVSQRIAINKGKAKEGGGGAAAAAAGGSNACLALLLQNTYLLSPPSHALQPFFVPPSSSAQKFDPNKLTVQGGDDTIKALTEAVRVKNAWKDVRDLDDHMEDTSVDWLNNSRVANQLVVAES